jgi:hypothetical protein
VTTAARTESAEETPGSGAVCAASGAVRTTAMTNRLIRDERNPPQKFDSLGQKDRASQPIENEVFAQRFD